jgi:hypothetical protein
MLKLKYKNIVLRNAIERDLADYEVWMTTETEWQNWDAPWEAWGESDIENFLDGIKKIC